jgi:hypothetical protein
MVERRRRRIGIGSRHGRASRRPEIALAADKERWEYIDRGDEALVHYAHRLHSSRRLDHDVPAGPEIVVSQSRGVKWGRNIKTTTSQLDAAGIKANRNRHRRATARALDLLPLTQELRDRGMNLNKIAAEFTRLEIRTPRGATVSVCDPENLLMGVPRRVGSKG